MIKTAKEILGVIEHTDFYISPADKIRIIQGYGKQVAEQTLDAAKEEIIEDDFTTTYGFVKNQARVERTIIVTP